MAMSLSSRDRRALAFLGIALVLFVALQSDWVLPAPGAAAASATNVEAAEQALLLAQTRARQMPLVAAESEALGKTLAALETGLLRTQTAALAQAEMREIMGSLLQAEGIAMQSSQFGSVELDGQDYARVPLQVNFTCGIEQFVNLLAAISNAPQLLSNRQIRIVPEGGPTKMVRVQLSVAGYLPSAKTPELIQKATSGGRP
jgi:hypothetical protein